MQKLNLIFKTKIANKNIFSKIFSLRANVNNVLPKRYFSDNKPNQENEASNEETHSDFKPAVKLEMNDENVMSIIDSLVKNNDVLIFMKGTREMPRCGFSNYVIQILNFYKIKKLKTVNILENPLMRESVKRYSNWPTYPQLYVKGNLVGGCDIIKEMHENGTFKEMIEREGISSD